MASSFFLLIVLPSINTNSWLVSPPNLSRTDVVQSCFECCRSCPPSFPNYSFLLPLLFPLTSINSGWMYRCRFFYVFLTPRICIASLSPPSNLRALSHCPMSTNRSERQARFPSSRSSHPPFSPPFFFKVNAFYMPMRSSQMTRQIHRFLMVWLVFLFLGFFPPLKMKVFFYLISFLYCNYCAVLWSIRLPRIC